MDGSNGVKTSICYRIGLTGGIACGKTLVSDYFSGFGVPVLDADILARELVQPGQNALREIVEAFGREVLHANGKLNRRVLRRIVFSDAIARKKLESILHPRIRRIMEVRSAAFEAPYCILSIPLLVESRQFDLVQRVLVIDCPLHLQHKRLAERDNLSENEIQAVLAVQCNRSTRLKYADDVLVNDAAPVVLYEKVRRMHTFYLELTASTTA